MRASRVGQGGGSNFSYLLERDEGRFVLRRPPRPPLPPSAHDMVREARLQLALAPHGIRLPKIRAVCDDESVLGVPFYVMDFLEGHVVTDTLRVASRPRTRGADSGSISSMRSSRSTQPTCAAGVADFVRPGSYLERQVTRFTQLWEINRTRDLPDVASVGAGSPSRCPSRSARRRPWRLPARQRDGCAGRADADRRVLDWEMGAVGDPRADVGYLLATYTEPGGEVSPLGASPVTATQGFPTKQELVDRYRAGSGRDVEPLAWFQALALWKAAVFCEAIYGRYVRGELAAEDASAARFELGVPLLARTALEVKESA